MSEQDAKVFLLNTATLGISMSTIETTLKILLLVVSVESPAELLPPPPPHPVRATASAGITSFHMGIS